MRWLVAAALLLTASCATTRTGKCPDKPVCLTGLTCSTNRATGCEECQCGPAHDDWRNRPANEPPVQRH